MTPRARQDDLLVQEVKDELILYDQKRHRAHTLNRTAALVWRHSDGQTTVADLAGRLERELKLPADETLVWLALDQLERAHLLRERLKRPHAAGISRREALRRLRRAGTAAFLLPVVTSIVAPTPVMAASPGFTTCASVGGVCFSGFLCASSRGTILGKFDCEIGVCCKF